MNGQKRILCNLHFSLQIFNMSTRVYMSVGARQQKMLHCTLVGERQWSCLILQKHEFHLSVLLMWRECLKNWPNRDRDPNSYCITRHMHYKRPQQCFLIKNILSSTKENNRRHSYVNKKSWRFFSHIYINKLKFCSHHSFSFFSSLTCILALPKKFPTNCA